MKYLGKKKDNKAASPPAGRLHQYNIPERSEDLREISLGVLSGELLARIDEGAFTSESEILLGCKIYDTLQSALDIHANRTSRKRYRDIFGEIYAGLGPLLVNLKDATIVDVGCGSINPFGLLFLFLMLGARRGIAIDLDEIQDMAKAVKALADCAAMVLIDPAGIIGDYPIKREQVLENISSFDLARMDSGDPSGVDGDRLSYRLDPASALSLDDGEADLVISNALPEHIGRVDEVIAEMARLTREGGFGIHRIDGADHRRYLDPSCPPLEFLTEVSSESLVNGCNRIRPSDFVPRFQRHGFEVISFTPFENIEIDSDLRGRLAEPFRSMRNETLEVIGARLVVRRSEKGSKVKRAVSEVKLDGVRETINYLPDVLKLIEDGRYPEALEELLKTPEIHPQYYNSVALCGSVRRIMGDLERAEQDLDRAIKLTRHRPEAFLYRAWLRLDQKRIEEGVEDAVRAGELINQGDSLEADQLDVLGLLYSLQGKDSEALEALGRLLEMQPEKPKVHVHRGWALRAAGQVGEARKEAETALALDPDDEEAKRLLELL